MTNKTDAIFLTLSLNRIFRYCNQKETEIILDELKHAYTSITKN